MKKSIYIGFDPREIAAYLVAVSSMMRKGIDIPWPNALLLAPLIKRGLYKRQTIVKDGSLFDVISEHPMSTEFSISRFFVPYLAQTGWALFVDCDVMALAPLDEIFEKADPKYAVMVVKHEHYAANTTKMDGRVQSNYSRKNWSSVCLWNCDHPANKALTLEYLNSEPGRVLHAFSWLPDELIGELPPEFNYLIGVTSTDIKPKMVHFTNGTPHMKGYETCLFADAWREELEMVIPNFLRVIGTIPA